MHFQCNGSYFRSGQQGHNHSRMETVQFGVFCLRHQLEDGSDFLLGHSVSVVYLFLLCSSLRYLLENAQNNWFNGLEDSAMCFVCVSLTSSRHLGWHISSYWNAILFIYFSASSVLTVNKVILIHFSEWDVMDRETWNQIIMCLAGILNEGMSIPHNCTHTNTHMQTIYLVYSAEWPPACRLSPGGRPQRPSSRQTACWTRTNHMHPGQKNSKRRMEQHLGRTQIGVIFYWNSEKAMKMTNSPPWILISLCQMRKKTWRSS